MHSVGETPLISEGYIGIGNFFQNTNKCIFVLHCNTRIMKTISIRISDELEKDLEAWVKESGRSQSDLIREALEKHIRIKSFREIREMLVPYAQKAGYYTDDDIFNDPELT